MLNPMVWRLCASLLLSAVAAAAGCGPVDENVPNISRFNSQPPLPPNPGGVPGLRDGGTSGTSGFDPNTACDGNPAAFVGVECDVSFADDVFPILKANCATGGLCHNQDNRLGAPLAPDADANRYWQIFTNFEFRSPQNAALPYVNICSTDPAESAISCNLAEATSCGFPMPPRTTGFPALSEADFTTITEWLKCGAPNE